MRQRSDCMNIKEKVIESIDSSILSLGEMHSETTLSNRLTPERKNELFDVIETALLAFEDARQSIVNNDTNPYFILPYTVAISLAGSVWGQLRGAYSMSNAMAKSGAAGKKAKYQPLKNLAQKLVSEKNFKSRRNAAKTIMSEIIVESKKLNIYLSQDQAEITITRWLKEMGLPANV